MAILEIVKYGEPVLRQVAADVPKVTSQVQRLITDMFDTMYASDGIGLAAPQVGQSVRIFTLDCTTDERRLPKMVFINPEIVEKEGAMVSWEGCLSFPNVFIDVKRYAKITVKAKDHKGRPFTITPEPNSLLCRAIQHELDHLNGILFVDHVIDKYGADAMLKMEHLPPIEPDRIIHDSYIDNQLIMLE